VSEWVIMSESVSEWHTRVSDRDPMACDTDPNPVISGMFRARVSDQYFETKIFLIGKELEENNFFKVSSFLINIVNM